MLGLIFKLVPIIFFLILAGMSLNINVVQSPGLAFFKQKQMNLFNSPKEDKHVVMNWSIKELLACNGSQYTKVPDALQEHEITTVAHLLGLSREDLRLRGLFTNQIRCLENALVKQGLELKQSEEVEVDTVKWYTPRQGVFFDSAGKPSTHKDRNADDYFDMSVLAQLFEKFKLYPKMFLEALSHNQLAFLFNGCDSKMITMNQLFANIDPYPKGLVKMLQEKQITYFEQLMRLSIFELRSEYGFLPKQIGVLQKALAKLDPNIEIAMLPKDHELSSKDFVDLRLVNPQISNVAINTIKEKGIHSTAELAQMSVKEMKSKNLGSQLIGKILTGLKKLGVNLSQN